MACSSSALLRLLGASNTLTRSDERELARARLGSPKVGVTQRQRARMIVPAVPGRTGLRAEGLAIPVKAANMTSNIADRLNFVSEAERRLLATVPRTTAWFDAQRDAILARAGYWDAMCAKWDFNHPELASSRRAHQVS